MKLFAGLLLLMPLPSFAEIRPDWFKPHAITLEMPGRNVGFGGSGLADFDKDGDLDFAVYNRGDGKLYWFEQRSKDDWLRHEAGQFVMSQLGCLVMDVDKDGWADLVIGGYWFRNTGKPRSEPFERYRYDSLIQAEIHDIVSADMDGDGRMDVVAQGDGDGLFWYAIPDHPAADVDWRRTVVTFAVRNDRDDIHGGIQPGGVGDLDGDKDPDVALPDRWIENIGRGREWVEHKILSGKRGPWGFSGRSQIQDLDGDGDADIVAVDCDGQNSGVFWLENNGSKPPRFRVRYLANQAPGTRGSFHSLRLADFDGDGDQDILVVEQEDPSILPQGASPRWIIFENQTQGKDVRFVERVVFDAKLGGHDAWTGDIDGDGDIDIAAKIWSVWSGNGNGGKVHIHWLENLRR